MRSTFLKRYDTPLLLSLALLALCVLAGLFAGAELQRTLTEMLIRIVIVVGLYIFIGNSGLMSFGHVAFMCVGAYGVAWLSVPPELKAYVLTGLPDWMLQNAYGHVVSTLGGAFLAGVAAFFSGLIIIRLSGIAISIATFALLAVINVVYSNWDSVTAGTSSVSNIPTPLNIWIGLAWAVLCLFVAQVHSNSRWGLQLRALREDSVAARASGVNLYMVSLLAFVLSGIVVGLGGGLEAQFIGVVTPDAFYMSQTFLFISMLIIGGSASLTGSVAGVTLLSALVEILVRLENGISLGSFTLQVPSGTQEVVLGIIMVIMLIVRPRGMLGHTEWRLGKPLAT